MFKNIEKPTLIFLIVSLVGLLIFLVGVILSVKFIFIDVKGKETIKGTIVDLSGERTTVEYKVYGRVYKKTYSVYSSSYYIGKEVNIYYDKDHPNKSSIAGMKYLILIVPGIGLLMTGIGGLGMFLTGFKGKYTYVDNIS